MSWSICLEFLLVSPGNLEFLLVGNSWTCLKNPDVQVCISQPKRDPDIIKTIWIKIKKNGWTQWKIQKYKKFQTSRKKIRRLTKNLHVSYKSQHQTKKYGCPQRRIWMFWILNCLDFICVIYSKHPDFLWTSWFFFVGHPCFLLLFVLVFLCGPFWKPLDVFLMYVQIVLLTSRSYCCCNLCPGCFLGCFFNLKFFLFSGDFWHRFLLVNWVTSFGHIFIT